MNKENLSVIIRQNILRKPYFWADYPLCLQISTNNVCTSKTGVLCSYCYPQHMIAQKKDYEDELSMEQIEWIFKDIHANGKNLSFYTLFLDNDGTGDDRLPEILKIGKQINPTKQNQTFSCGVLTEKIPMLCDKNLDWICLTVSAANRTRYKEIYHADKFDAVIKNMKYITDHHARNQKLKVHYVITEKNVGEMKDWWVLMGTHFPDWKRVFSPLVESYDNTWSHEAMGKLTLEQQEEQIRAVDYQSRFWDHRVTSMQQPCVLWNNASINAHGTMLQCCNWANYKKHNYGNIKTYMKENRSIRDYWMERIANKQRNRLCDKCNLKRDDWKQRLDAIQITPKIKVMQ